MKLYHNDRSWPKALVPGRTMNGGYLEISRQTGIKVLFVAEVPFAAAKYLEVIGSSDPERALVIGSPIRTPSSIFTF